MNRLEQAARIAMGEFQDTDIAAPRLPISKIRFVVIGAALLLAVVVVLQLVL